MFQKPNPIFFSNEEDQAYSPALRALTLGLGAGSAFQAHSYLMRENPGSAATAYRWAETFEDRTPAHLGRMFGLAERRSAYVWDEVRVPYSDLVQQGQLTDLGQHLQRLIGGQLGFGGVKGAAEGMVFRRSADPSDPYMYLAGREDIRVRWEKTGRRTGASSRLDSPLFEKRTRLRWGGPSPFLTKLKRNWKAWKGSQFPRPYSSNVTASFEGQVIHVQPHSAMTGQDLPGKARDYWNRIRINAFELFERPQRLMADVGFGLKEGSYNKIFHFPFVGEGGIINGMLVKRVLPVAIAATALGYADYLTDHRISDYAVSLPLRANVLRADLTDAIPGARSVTSLYEETVPGPQYGPLALPLAGMTVGALWHYQKVLRGAYGAGKAGQKARAFGAAIRAVENEPKFLKYFAKSPVGIGTAVGLLAALPFIPGMLGSRKTGQELRDIYSGREPVPVRAGRWWDLGSTPFEGSRIKTWRPHWYQLRKTRAEKVSLYGSEKEYWAHHPLLHPFRYLRDPYWLERQHYADRPYPITSPAFSNVPLIGPLLAATIGKLVKPPVRMHPEWDGTDYTLYSSRLEPPPGYGLPPPIPRQEFGLGHMINAEAHQAAEWLGAMGFLGESLYNKAFPDYDKGKDVYFQGSRQMTSLSRRYYERELGAGFGPELGEEGARPFGYTEPFRRFVQREESTPQVNEIPNQMPSWLPGEDYFINFRQGDPYVKIDMGYARLPGEGYAALHPELQGLTPEEYPDLEKFKILGDVAPYSQEFASYRARIGAQAKRSTEISIEYEKVMERVRQTKESVVRTTERRFTGDIDEISGTIKTATTQGIELEEFPGRTFTLSSVGYSAADLSALALAEQNQLNKSQVARDVESRQIRLASFLQEALAPGTGVRLTLRAGAAEYGEKIRAVVETPDLNINRALITEGLARYRKDYGGPEAQAMHGVVGKTIGKLAESVAFTGDNSAVNPLRYIPTPGHTKLWQTRTPLEQYEQEEAIGSRMRRWHRPIHDFLAPYARNVVKRLTGQRIIGEDTQYRRDLNTLTDTLKYLRGEVQSASDPSGAGRYTSQASRTSIGANLFAAPSFIASTLPDRDRDAQYFRRFLMETDPEKRKQILSIASPELARALEAQWAAMSARIARAGGEEPISIGENGRLYSEDGVAQYEKATTQLGYGDYMRSAEIAQFFHRTGFHLPDPSSEIWSGVFDYDDVKLKILQNEGYDMHDFGIFEDRANLLWRKPWLDGAARELTSGESRSTENLRRQIEQIMLAAKDKDPDVRATSTKSRRPFGKVRFDVDVSEDKALLKDMRRNPERYDK